MLVSRCFRCRRAVRAGPIKAGDSRYGGGECQPLRGLAATPRYPDGGCGRGVPIPAPSVHLDRWPRTGTQSAAEAVKNAAARAFYQHRDYAEHGGYELLDKAGRVTSNGRG